MIAAYRIESQTDTAAAKVELQGLRKDASEIPIEVSSSHTENEHGKVVISAIRDITEHKRQESLMLEKNAALANADRAKDRFLASMSHELRTPLNAIIGFSELIYDDKVSPDTPQYHEFLGCILSSGQHLLQLINDVLDLSKGEAGKLASHPEAVNLGALLGGILTTLGTLAASRQIRIETDIEPTLTDIVLDAARFKQVLYNYISNALKFTPAAGRVLIRMRQEVGSPLFFRVEVRDTGTGIAPEDIRRLFVGFQQVNTGSNGAHQGTGLGLALTKRLVESQGGTVGVSSVPGEGSTFYAALPKKAAPNAAGDLPTYLRPQGNQSEV